MGQYIHYGLINLPISNQLSPDMEIKETSIPF